MMASPPSPLVRLLDRTPIRAIYAEVRGYLAATSGKTLVGLILCPILITLVMRLANVQTARAMLALWTPAKLDLLYQWYCIFLVQFSLFYVIPVLCIKLGFREPLSEYGHQLRPLLRLWPLLLLFLAVMLPVTYAASLKPSFSTYYPLYRGSLESFQKFVLFEAGFLIVFFTQEFFFRGFLIEILKPKFGMNAILIASAMYGIAHYSKPLPEQLGAFIVGIVLGYIGDRYRTFYFGVIIHYLIAVSMDAFLVVPALLR
jgi:uncharacterized protein